MSTATEEITTEYVEPDPTPNLARFQAPGEGLRLVIEPKQERVDQFGKKSAIANSGKTIEFVKAGRSQVYETTDPDEIEFLRAHPVKERNGFFEVPVPKPPAQPVLMKVIELATARDAAALVDLFEKEQQGWKRPEVLEAITAAANALEAAAAPPTT